MPTVQTYNSTIYTEHIGYRTPTGDVTHKVYPQGQAFKSSVSAKFKNGRKIGLERTKSVTCLEDPCYSWQIILQSVLKSLQRWWIHPAQISPLSGALPLVFGKACLCCTWLSYSATTAHSPSISAIQDWREWFYSFTAAFFVLDGSSPSL